MENIANGLYTPRKSGGKKGRRTKNCISAKATEYFEKIEKNMKTSVSDKRDVNEPLNSVESPLPTPNKKTHTCNICGVQLAGDRAWNLAIHLKHRHVDIFNKISAGIKEPLPVVRLKILQNCTETVSVNGRPFEWIHDTGYRKQFQKTLDELAAAKMALNLTESNLTEVKEHLKKTAKSVREKIEGEVKNRPLSLLIDLVTKHNRSILGISLQYTYNGSLKVRSIGFIELNDKHTGVYLAGVIIKRLEDFNIKLSQIFTITTDNGRNVLKMVRDMSDILETEINKAKENQATGNLAGNQIDTLSSEGNSDQIDAEISQFLLEYRKNFDNENDDVLEEAMNEMPLEQHQQTILDVMTKEVKKVGNITWNITGVNCAAHTIQLAINDAISKLPSATKHVIELCRETSKFLRLVSTRNEVAQMNIEYKLPRLEVPTRWSSMFFMVRIILYLPNKHFSQFSLFSCDYSLNYN